jgi:hypothetical protein
VGTQAGEIARKSTLNVAIGHKSLSALQLGSRNCTLGAMSGAWASSISSAVFVGYSSGANATGDRNTLVGAYAGTDLQGDDNTVLGISALENSAGVSLSNNTVTGTRCAANLCGNLNVIMGADTASDACGDRNSYLGAHVAPTVEGSDNVVIGTDNTRKPNLRYSNCVIVGQRIEPKTATFLSNSIYIGKDLQIEDTEARNSLVIGIGASKYIVANENTMTVLTGSFNATSTGADSLTVEKSLRLGIDNTFLQSETRLYVSSTKGSDTNRGTSPDRPLKTIRRACALAREYATTIFVEGGTYIETNPIYVKPGTSIIGDSLRRCVLYALSPTLDYFHTAEATFFTGLRFLNLQAPAVCVAFPCALAKANVSTDLGTVTGLQLLYQPPNGYLTAPSILIDPPQSTTGTYATASVQFSGTSITGLTVTSPGSGYSSEAAPVHISIPARPYVRASATCSLTPNGEIANVVIKGYDTLNAEVPLTGYTTEYLPQIYVAKPSSSTGIQAKVSVGSLHANGAISSVTIGDAGTGYTSAPSMSIDSPPFQQPIVRASPYVLNCTAVSGPFHKFLGNVVLRVPPYSTDDIDRHGAGGGLRVDGAVVSNISTLRSMVSSAFTQVCQGGCGFYAVNAGYMQLVSCFTTFASVSVLATSGGFINLSNSVTDFGDIGLKAAGYFRVPYSTGTVTESYRSSVGSVAVTNGGAGYTAPTANVTLSGNATAIASVDTSVASIVVTNGGSGYTSRPSVVVTSSTGRNASATADIQGGVVMNVVINDGGTDYVKASTSVTFSGGGGSGATATVLIGKVTRIDVTSSGSGYLVAPTVTIAQPQDAFTPKQVATASVQMVGPTSVRMNSFPVIAGTGGISRRPDIGSIANVYGVWCTVTGVTETVTTGTYDVIFSPKPTYANVSDQLDFHLVSYITSGSHVCEYVGTGISYNALPEYGGIPDTGKQVESVLPGRVYYVTTDNNGNTRFGPFFSIDQSTGSVTLASDNLNLNLSALSAIGPFRYNGSAVGSRLQEVTNSETLDSQSVPSETVPTITAVKAYVRAQSVPSGGLTSQVLKKASNTDRDVLWGDADTIVGTSPTLFLQDTDHKSAMIHCNSNLLYFLGGPVNSKTWAQVNGQWPMYLNLANNDCVVGGSISAVYNITAYASDQRLKSNVCLLDHALDKLLKLRGVSFDWNPEGPQPMRGHDVGLIAQDVQTVLEEAVTLAPFDRDPHGNSKSGHHYLTIDSMSNKLMALVVEAIKELAHKVETLEKISV